MNTDRHEVALSSRKASAVVAAVLVCLMIAPALASAQWVEFTNDTRNRLRVRPFNDGSGAQRTDAEEKDMAVGDLNRDGWDDMVVVRKRPFSVPGPRQDILLMNRRGKLVDLTARFAPEFLTAHTDARDVFIADFTGDDWPDVVIANTFGQQPRFYRNLGDDVNGRWLGLGDESELRFPEIVVPDDANTLQICAVFGGDLTGNGALDLYFSNYISSGGTKDFLFINDGAGFFTNETTQRLGQNANVAFGTSVEIHDMDLDGDNDIVKISALYNAPPFNLGQYILFNDGTGDFDNLPFQALPSDAPYMFTVADFSGDMIPDLYLEGDNQDRVATATGNPQDGPIPYDVAVLNGSSRTSGLGGNTKAVDIDGDGDLDMGVGPIDVDIGNCNQGYEFALLENQSGTLVENWAANDKQVFHVDPHDFAFLDIDRDGCMDIVMGMCTGWEVLMQTCEM